MARRRRDSGPRIGDVLAAVAGGTLGLAVGYLAAGAVGRVDTDRLRRAVARLKRPVGAGLWTAEASDDLERRVIEALHQDVVLARRAIKVTVLGQGLVELTGRVLHAAEIGLAGAAAQGTPGVHTVLNHLMLAPPREAGGGPASPRVAG